MILVDRQRFLFLNVELIFPGTFLEILESSFTVFPKFMVVSYHQTPCFNLPGKNLLNELSIRKLRKLFGKRINHQVVDPQIFEKFLFFFQRCEQPKIGFTGCGYQPGVREESENNGFSVIFLGQFL